MKRIIKLFSWIFILTFIVSFIGCNGKHESKPILRVITGTQVGLTIFSKNQYYIVYDNGKTKKTSEFTPTEVKHYAFQTSEEQTTPYLYHIDIDSKEGIELNNIAKDIVETINSNEIITSPGKLFLIDGSYFFTAFIKKGEQYKVALLEYLNDNKTIIEIATFKGDISHVEPYE